MLHIHSSGQTQFIITGFLWRASDSSSGESQHFQTCSKPKGLRQACFSYLPAFLPLNNLHGPQNPVNIYVSSYIRDRPTELRSNISFIYDPPLTRLTEASNQAGGNQMSAGCSPGSWAQLHTWGPRLSHVCPRSLWPTQPTALDFSLCSDTFAVKEVEFLSVSRIRQGIKDGTGVGGRGQDWSHWKHIVLPDSLYCISVYHEMLLYRLFN